MRSAVALAFTLAVAPALAALPDWRPVPGAESLELALDSVDLQGSRVAALVRAPAGAIRLARDARQRAASRVVLLADFDCAARTMQTLALVAYGRGGTVLASQGAPTAPVPLRGDDSLLAAYDALCELARDRR
jgi:hypothetical protein